jgi:Family of unknown function (DUF1028)
MTWSIIAKDGETGWFGIGIATRFFAVGALCPLPEAGLGAICSQAHPNPAVPMVMATDEGRGGPERSHRRRPGRQPHGALEGSRLDLCPCRLETLCRRERGSGHG